MTVSISLDGATAAAVLRGLAGLTQMIGNIGETDDHAVAKILVEGEMDLRALQKFALMAFAKLVVDD